MVKHGNTRASDKRWVLLITCCWTRAVAMQVVQSESAYSAYLAMERHCASLGTPRRINLDNGSNFEGMKNDYKKQWELVEKVLKKMALKWPAVEFNFNPSRSPRFGGHYEIFCKAAKVAMKKVLPLHRLLNDEEFLTVVAKNRRPTSFLCMMPHSHS